jgi:ribosomal protein S1
MEIEIKFNTTEYAIYPDKKIEKTVFSINDKSVIINFCDNKDKIISQSEIELSDAKKLANILINI